MGTFLWGACAAIQNNKIQVYPEYSGTISEAILKQPLLRELTQIRAALKPMGLTISDSLGFNNTYALAVRREYARAHHLLRISDLRTADLHPRGAFSNEFVTRQDGLVGLLHAYSLEFTVQSLEHSLAYQALAADKA